MLHFQRKQNLYLLESGLQLLSVCNAQDYTAIHSGHSASIGAHFRHIFEHYECFFSAKNTEVLYHLRKRNSSLETDLQRAILKCNELIAAIKTTDNNFALSVYDEGSNEGAPSSVCRELLFLASHTVHHYAIIKLIAIERNLPVPDNFGVAFSTIAYRKTVNVHSNLAK